jgi:hypothetical protein
LNLENTKKYEINPLLIQQQLAKIRSITSDYSSFYTNGSMDGDRVTSAAALSEFSKYEFTRNLKG